MPLLMAALPRVIMPTSPNSTSTIAVKGAASGPLGNEGIELQEKKTGALRSVESGEDSGHRIVVAQRQWERIENEFWVEVSKSLCVKYA